MLNNFTKTQKRKDIFCIMLCCGRTDIGRIRQFNQDSFYCETYDNGMLLAVVCDGMGGAAGGGIASGLACAEFVDTFSEFAENFPRKEKLTRTEERLLKSELAKACEKANTRVYTYAANDESLKGMGTTIVATLAICNTVFTLNVGDSRMYLVHGNKIDQITHDHSYVQYLVDLGRMTKEQAEKSENKNIITKAVGTTQEIEPDIFVNHLNKKKESIQEYIAVLCSDGLSNHVTPDEIVHCVTGAEHNKTNRSLGHFCQNLIDCANIAGGNDNITAVLVTV